jgi:TP901 family phage tail tape measure protein
MALAETGIRYIIDPSQAEAGARRVNQSLSGITENALRQAARQNMIMQRLPQRYIFLSMDLQQTAVTMSAAFTLPFTLAAGAAIKFASDFQTAMRDVNSIAQLTEEQFASLSQDLQDIAAGSTILAGPTELAKGLYEVYSSGKKGAEGMNIMQISAEGATAGLTDVDVAAKATLGVINAYGEEAITAQQAMDIMFRTVDQGILRFEDLAQGIGVVLAPAARANITFGELGAALVSMTRAGIPPAEAMTYLTRAIESIIDPSNEAIKLAEELGVQWDVTALRNKGLLKTLQDMEEATYGNERVMSTLIGEQRAARAVLSVLRDGANEYSNALVQMRQAQAEGGDTARALDQQLKSPGASMRKLKSDAELLGISFGEVLIPGLTAGVGVLRNFTEMLGELPDEVKTAAFAFGGLLAALGPLGYVGARVVQGFGTMKNVAITFGSSMGEMTRVAAEAAAQLDVLSDALSSRGFVRVAPDLFGNLLKAQALERTTTAGTIAAVAATEARVKAEAELAAALTGRQLAEIKAAQAAITDATAQGTLVTTTDKRIVQEFQLALAAEKTAIAELQAANAARGAAAATVTFGQALMGLTLVGAAVGVAVLAENMVQEHEAARLAALSAADLTREYDKLANARQRLDDTYTAGGRGVSMQPQFALNRPGTTMGQIKDLIGVMPEDVAKAIQQLKQTMLEEEEDLHKAWEQKVKGLQGIMAKAIDMGDPELLARAGEAFTRLIEEGVGAADRAAIEKIPYTARKAINDWVQSWEDAAKLATPEIAREIQAAIDNALAFVGGRAGIKVTIPVEIQTVVGPSQIVAETNLAKARRQLASETAALEGEERWWKTNLSYVNKELQANKYALEDAQEGVRAAQAAVSSLSDALSEAKDRLQNFSHPVLIGMREIDDAIFQTQMKLAGLQMQLLQMSAQWDPMIAGAEKAVLEARLAYLMLGEAAEDAGKKGQEAVFDLAEAQRRELREGTPVAMQYAEWLKNRKPTTPQEGESQQEADLRNAQKLLEILQIQKQLAMFNTQQEYNQLNTQEQIMENQKKLDYDEKMRTLERMADTRVPISYEEAVEGVQQALVDVETLNEQLAGANSVLEARKGVVDDLEEAQRALNRKQDDYQDALDGTKEKLDRLDEAYDPILRALEKTVADLEKMKDLPAIEPKINVPEPVTATVDVKFRMDEAAQAFQGTWKGGTMTPEFGNPFAGIQDWLEDFFSFLQSTPIGQPETPIVRQAEGGIVPGAPGEPTLVMAEGGERFMGNQGPDRDTWNITQHNYGSSNNQLRDLQRLVTLKRLTRRRGRRL